MEAGQHVKKVVKIIQARTSSSRLPRKVLMDVNGTSLLENTINQVNKVKYPGAIWVVTSSQSDDDIIELICSRLGVNCFRGSLEDVRSRFLEVGQKENAEIIVRVTADNPLTEPSYIDDMIRELIGDYSRVDYVRMEKNIIPDGTGSEVFKFSKFVSLSKENDSANHKEHVTPRMISDSMVKEIQPSNLDLNIQIPLFLGVDNYDDLYKVNQLLNNFIDLKGIIKAKKNERF